MKKGLGLSAIAMGDSNPNAPYFDYVFSVFVCIEGDANSYSIPRFMSNATDTNTLKSNALGAFRSYDLTNFFSLSGSFDTYADSECVIRLFPTFSNGKNYDATGKDDGGADTLRMVAYTNYGEDNQEETFSKSMFYVYTDNSNGGNAVTYNDGTQQNITLNYAMAVNIELKNYSDNTIVFSCAYTDSEKNWAGSCATLTSINSTAINKILDEYGNGIYLFYVLSAIGQLRIQPVRILLIY